MQRITFPSLFSKDTLAALRLPHFPRSLPASVNIFTHHTKTLVLEVRAWYRIAFYLGLCFWKAFSHSPTLL